MGKSILSVPDEHLADFIYVLYRGLSGNTLISDEVNQALGEWMDEAIDYLLVMQESE